MPKAIQVITDDLEYTNEIESYIQNEGMSKAGTNYRNIAIIGCQSSGKSTLLNILFDTTFEELNQKTRGMAQTTKGVWSACNSNKDVLIFDIEGTDSRERGDDRMTFEQTTSLFALALADVLIINLWTTDVGRYQASNYGLLKVIFEVNLKLFAQSQSQKKLVFVLRDFNPHENNEDSMRTLLENNVKTIWKEIYKEEKYANSTPHDFFDFEFFMLPHKIYQPKDFKDAALNLREKFTLDSEISIFPKTESGNLPIDGFPMYIENWWKCIREQKELNLPGEKQMVATYRCNMIKQEAIEVIQQQLKSLEERSYDGIIDDFKYQWGEVLSKAYVYYDQNAKQYYVETFNSVRAELTNAIYESLFKSFCSQIKNLVLQVDGKFHKAMKKRFPDDVVANDFTKVTEDLYDDVTKQFIDWWYQLMLDESDWRKTVDLYRKDLSSGLQKAINDERSKQMEKLFNFSVENICDILEKEVTEPIKNLEDDFWRTIKKNYRRIIEEKEEDIKNILNEGFKTLEDEYDNFILKIEDKIYTNCKKFIVKTTNDINSHMNRKFNTIFKKDSNGKNRDWKLISEEDIEKLFTDWVRQFDNILENFRKIEIPKNVTSEYPTMTLTSSFHREKEALLTEDEITKVKDKFEDDWDHALEEAKRLHHNIYGGGIPYYFWIIFVFFAYDDILRWLSTPILFLPLVFLATAALLLQSLGLLMPLIQTARIMFNMGYAQIQNSRKNR